MGSSLKLSDEPVVTPRAAAALARRAALLLALAASPGLTAAAPDALTLRLDDRLTATVPGPSDGATERLLRFGASDIHRRIQRSRDENATLARKGAEIAQRLAAYEGLVERLRDIHIVQDRTIAAVEQAMDERASERATMAAAGAAPRRSTPASTPPPATAARARSAAVPAREPPVPVLELAGLRVDRTVLEVAMAALIVVLLVTIALGARRRGGVPEHAVAAAGALPAAAAAGATVASRSASADGDGEPVAPRSPAPVPESMPSAPRSTSSASPCEPGSVPSAPAPGSESVPPSPGSTPRAPAPPPAPAMETGEDTDIELDRALAAIHESDDADDAISHELPAAAAKEAGIDTLVDFDPLGTLPQATDAAPRSAPGERPMVDRDLLKELDTLIAFEHYERAKLILDDLLESDPRNPEYLLRHYHVRTAGGIETHDGDEELLKVMMDGPLSDTMQRVREIGRSLMPGDPLFSDDGSRDAARKLLGESQSQPGAAGDSPEPAARAEDRDHTKTVVLSLMPKSD